MTNGAHRDPSRLVLLRHGESVWNEQGLFTGWVDVGLSERGAAEAESAGRMLSSQGLLPDVVHTSVLVRSIRTAELALAAAEREWIPVRRSWRLNERHYGALQGKSKEQTRVEFGDEQFMLWRRSYDVPAAAPTARLGAGPVARSSVRGAAGGRVAGERMPERRPGTGASVLVRLDRAGPLRREGRARGSARELTPGPGEASRSHPGIGDRRAEHPDRRSAALRARRRDAPVGRVDPRFGVSGTYLDPDAASSSIEGVRAQGSAHPSGR